ncbi:MAG: nucleic acid-binding protein [Methanomassiliicoccaceae archaeon]|nr:nucleic acid-binding protein [Methanomassiliicoccaceae archaeon]
MLILDSSALFSMEGLPEEEFLCPPGVVDELAKYDDKRLDLWGDLLRTSDCTKPSVEKVTEAAKKSGDLGRLSPVDISVLALAVDTGGTILSDDYSIQNVSRIMGIPFKPVGTTGISKVEKWNYRCVGCGKWFKEKADECVICGSGMKAHRKR